MKRIPLFSILLALLFSQVFSSCDKDNPQQVYTIELADLLSVDDDKKTYTIGETIWFNINVPNSMTDVGGKEINVKALSNPQAALTNIKFFKETGFALPSHLRLSIDDYVVEKGQMELFPFETLMRTRAEFQEDSFQFRFGVLLAETGNYFISTPSGEGDFETFFDVAENSDVGFRLLTSIKGGDVNNRFHFSVTE